VGGHSWEWGQFELVAELGLLGGEGGLREIEERKRVFAGEMY